MLNVKCSRFAWQLLAAGANMSAPAGDADFFDGGAAAWARLSYFTKNLGEGQITPPLTLGIDVIAVGAAALFDAHTQNVAQVVI